MHTRAALLLSLGLSWIADPLVGQTDEGARHASGADSRPPIVVRQLLKDLWSRSLKNRKQAESVFADAPHNGPTLLAYTLNRMQHNRNRQAAEVVRELVEGVPDDPNGWVLKSWLDAVTNEYDRALVAISRLAKLVSQKKVAPELETLVVKQMGRLIGYMQGPVATTVNPDSLDLTLETIQQALTPEQWTTFDVEREKVLTRYGDLTNRRSEVEQHEMQKAQEQIDRETKSVQAENVELERRQGELSPRRDRIQAESARELARLAELASPVEQSLVGLSSRIDALTYDLSLLYADIAYTQNQLDRHPRDYYLRQRLADLYYQVRALEYDLASVQSGYVRARSQLQGIQSQMASVQAATSEQLRQLRAEEDRIRKQMRWNRKKLAKLAEGPKVSSGKLGAIDNRATSLTTYNPFPLEWFRDYLWTRHTSSPDGGKNAEKREK